MGFCKIRVDNKLHEQRTFDVASIGVTGVPPPSLQDEALVFSDVRLPDPVAMRLYLTQAESIGVLMVHRGSWRIDSDVLILHSSYSRGAFPWLGPL